MPSLVPVPMHTRPASDDWTAALGQSPTRTEAVSDVNANATSIDVDYANADMAAVKDPNVVILLPLTLTPSARIRHLWFLFQSALHLLARVAAGLGSLARDACKTMYASYPAKDGDEFL